MNSEWESYGSIPITIDTATLGNASFTYQDLVDSGADVVILSDPAGGNQQYTESEIAAVLQYASEGHSVIGTYLVFRHLAIDNRGLAPVFGLRSDIEYKSGESISNLFSQLDTEHHLFTGLPSPTWTSQGFSFTQAVSDDLTWDTADLDGAKMVAQADSFRAMISVYDAPAYTGIYISNMPEHFGTGVDKQLLYNAIIFQSEFGTTTPLPGLSQWALIGLAAALAGLGFLKLRKRHPAAG